MSPFHQFRNHSSGFQHLSRRTTRARLFFRRPNFELSGWCWSYGSSRSYESSGQRLSHAAAGPTAPAARPRRRTEPEYPPRPTCTLRRRECNRHTYSRLLPINASATKAACDRECGRIWQRMQWVHHALARDEWRSSERDGGALRPRAAFKFITSVV